jgi:hypothetical protein
MINREWKEKDPTTAFFPVELRPLFMKCATDTSRYNRLPRHLAVVDVENDNPFSVVTDSYELVTNEEAYNNAADIMRRVFHTTTIDDMICLNVTMPHTRSFCHIDLVHKSADFSPLEKDKWTAFLRITNSYNRTRLLRFELGFCRWICMNGMIFGSKSIEYSYAHTRGRMEQTNRFIENIGDIRKLEALLTEKLQQLQRYYVPEANMLAILCRAFDIKVTKDDINKQKRVENLKAIRERTSELTRSYFLEMGPHGYAALNVLTDYATRPEGVFAPETSMNSLQQKCGNWMDDFVSSIQKPDFSFDRYLEGYRQSAELIESL